MRHPLVMDVAAAALMAAAAGLRKGGPGAAGATHKPGADLGSLLTATALEGVRRLSDAAAAKANGSGPNAGKPGAGRPEGGAS